MDLLTKLRGLTYLGFRTLLKTVTYSLSRDAIERRHGARRPPAADTPVGEVSEAVRTARGGIFRLDAAELEVVFLAPDMARFTWTPGALPVPYAIAKDDWAAVEPAWTAREDTWELSTADLHVTVARDGAVTLRSEGRVLREDLPPVRRGEGWAHRSRPRADARHFGMGERTGPFDLTGGSFRLWNSEAEGAYGPGKDPLYLCVPVWLTVHGDGSLLTFFEDPSRGRVTFRDPVEASFDGGALRYYAIPGPADRALDRYTELTGRPSMPPRWALLFHQSRWSYMDEAEVREVADGFAARGLPLAAIHLDIHYMDGHRVFTVDRKRFPDMARLARDLDAKGVKLVAILDPGVKVDPAYDAYREVVGRKAACTLPDGRPATALVWPGTCVFPDFTAPAAREWWAERYRFFAENGFAGAWHDMNEPAAFAAWGDPTLPLAVRHSMEGRGGDHVEAHNLYALLEARAGYEGLMRNRPDRRPWILSRSGWAGLQRWAWNWTGDSESDWWTLAQTVRMVMAMGLSGVPYTGADVGGFGGNPTPELFVRWFQAASFMPFFRVHSAWFVARREPWRFDDATQAALAAALRTRAALMPYLYTLAAEAHRTGHPLCRPIGWPDSPDPAAWAVDHEFLLGDAILVAPVLEPGATARDVVLPAGRWHLLWDDAAAFDGPGTVTVPAPADRIPVLVRDGSVVPMDEDGRTVLHVWPPADLAGASDSASDGVAAQGGGMDGGVPASGPKGAAVASGAEGGGTEGAGAEGGGTEGVGAQGGGELYCDAGDGWGAWRVDRFRVRRTGPSTCEVTRTGAGDFPLPGGGFAIRIRGVSPPPPLVEAGTFERIEV